MRVVIASADAPAVEWLTGLLSAAGLSVVVLDEPGPSAPELAGCELLIADHEAAAAVGGSGPERRLLLIPRGQAVDLTAAMRGGFMDLLVVPSPEDEILGRVGRALDHFLKPVAPTEGGHPQVQELKDIVERITTALKTSRSHLRRTVHELAEGMLSVFLLLIDSHESTDRGTPGHSRKAGVLAREVARRLGRSDEEAAWIELAGRLHDIGLVALGIQLSGEAPLSLKERRVVEQHPRLSAEILGPLRTWGLPVDAIRDHHERIDGSGYPKGRSELSLEAQVIGAADVYEALTSPRPWRPAEERMEALSAMRAGGGFAADVLDALEAATAEGIDVPGPLPAPLSAVEASEDGTEEGEG